jgi:zeaxanthin glucosyltransferase
MATLVFCIFNFQGELNGSLNLAKKLKTLGHQVHYLGLADSRKNVQSHGFEFLTILETWFPVGFFKQLDFNNVNKWNLISRVLFVRKIKKFIDSLIYGDNKEIHLIFKQIDPDLLILSTTEGAYATFLGLIAHECRLPSIYLTDMFPSLPQCKSEKDYHKNNEKEKTLYLHKLRNFLNLYIFENLVEIPLWLLGVNVNYKQAIHKLLIEAGVPSERLDLSNNSPLKLTHLFLCPKEFELPSLIRENCCYAEPSIDLSREQDLNFCWNKLDQNKKIIYCSLGTTSGTFETLGMSQVKKFFHSIINCISLFFKSEYQLVIAASTYIESEFLKISLNGSDTSKDIIIQQQLPQLALLKRSSLAIISGGIHTVKECIFFGVSMIVFPVWADQFENAERVRQHSLGLVGDMNKISSEHMRKLIYTIKNGLFFYDNLELWKQKFREAESSNKAKYFILDNLKSTV